jgi:tetratricopeptide (TPR) repeat protein
MKCVTPGSGEEVIVPGNSTFIENQLFTLVFNQKEERAMKRILVCISLAVMTACQPGPSQKEDKAIIATIQDEINGFQKKNTEKWAAQWIHEPTSSHTAVGPWYYVRTVNWDSIKSSFKGFLSDTSAFSWKSEKFGFKIHNYGKVAFVACEERTLYESRPNSPDTSDEFFVLEKRNGKWLIADLLAIGKASYKNTDRSIENNLNITGYQLMARNKLKEAIEVLQLDARLFPGSANVFDSLGEAYMKSGQKSLAIQNYDKSLKLNPKNKNAVEMLKKLKGR